MKTVPIKGYEGRYTVNENGDVFSLRYNIILKQSLNKGYSYVSLYKKGASIRFRVHRIVAIAFIDNPLELKEVNHKNGVKTDNNVENLEWCTSSQNRKHSWETGLQPKRKPHFNVSYHNRSRKWRLQFGSKYVGLFDTKEEAIESANAPEEDIYRKHRELVIIK